MCNCHNNMDIRGRCCPVFYNEDFLKCPAKIDTALFHFENDYECYKKLEKCIEEGLNTYPIFINFLTKFNMCKDDIKKVAMLCKKRYEEALEEDYGNSHYICKECKKEAEELTLMNDEDEEGLCEDCYKKTEEHPAHKFFNERDCAYCRLFFDEGKDFCKECGFDLNSWNKAIEEYDNAVIKKPDVKEIIESIKNDKTDYSYLFDK